MKRTSGHNSAADSAQNDMYLDKIDRAIINQLQYGFPICDEPYREAAQQFGIGEKELISRLQRMLDEGILSRFGPMYHAERLGGGLSLAAMKIPVEDFERVNEQVNAFDEVAHNYAREHALNMWFVLATENPEEVEQSIQKIEQVTGYRVYNMPKQQEFFVGLHFSV